MLSLYVRPGVVSYSNNTEIDNLPLGTALTKYYNNKKKSGLVLADLQWTQGNKYAGGSLQIPVMPEQTKC